MITTETILKKIDWQEEEKIDPEEVRKKIFLKFLFSRRRKKLYDNRTQVIEIFSISKAKVFTEITISNFAIGQILKKLPDLFFRKLRFLKIGISERWATTILYFAQCKMRGVGTLHHQAILDIETIYKICACDLRRRSVFFPASVSKFF